MTDEFEEEIKETLKWYESLIEKREKVEVEDGDRIENEEMLKEKMKDERSMKEEEMENYLIMKNAEKSEE